jgi:hypothetical protein
MMNAELHGKQAVQKPFPAGIGQTGSCLTSVILAAADRTALRHQKAQTLPQAGGLTTVWN